MSDLISRQAILKKIENIRQGVQMMDDTRRASIIMNGMHLCEEAVRYQPSADTDLSDYSDRLWKNAYERGKAEGARIPSAQPERKKPDHGYMWICPECGLEVHSDFARCVRCGWERTSADLTCDGCATPKTLCGICMRNYPNITDHYCTGEAWKEVRDETAV